VSGKTIPAYYSGMSVFNLQLLCIAQKTAERKQWFFRAIYISKYIEILKKDFPNI
jgi:uncharacterized secreted protein with C-terminal beta-propeller domain